MIKLFLLVFLGFAALIIGANWLVNGASGLAKKMQVSDLVIGLTIVAFGTSAPELIVNIVASLNGSDDIILGNIIGSNNFNLFVILGIAGLIYPIKVQSSTAWKEIPFSLIAAGLVLLLANNFFVVQEKVLTRMDGVMLLLCFVAFLFYVFRQLKTEAGLEVSPATASTLQLIALVVLGFAGLIFGGQLVVKNSVSIAQELGISEKTIGLTIVAAGTSLPELVTSMVAAFKRKSDIAIGNVVGSNVFNLLFILPISAVISPIRYSAGYNIDLGLVLIGTLLLLAGMISGQKKQLDRWEAGLLLLIFVGYTGFLLSR